MLDAVARRAGMTVHQDLGENTSWFVKSIRCSD
jgi:hypothetical protein